MENELKKFLRKEKMLEAWDKQAKVSKMDLPCNFIIDCVSFADDERWYDIHLKWYDKVMELKRNA